MKKFDKMKKDFDLGLPAIGILLDAAVADLPKKTDRFFYSVAEGFEKFFHYLSIDVLWSRDDSLPLDVKH